MRVIWNHGSSEMMKTLAVWQFLGSLQLILALRFSPVTQEVGLSDTVGRIAAFADFNADKVTDVLVLNSTGSEHTILLWNGKSHRFIQNDIKLDVPTPIAEVKIGDFNGDGVVDILTLHSEVEDRRCYTPTLHLCQVTDGRVTVKSKSTAIELEFMSNISLPLVLDISGDHIPDLFATTCNGRAPHTPTFFISTISDGSFRFTPQPLHPSPAPDITNSYFVDLDSDCLPELVLYREANRSMEVWKEREGEGFVMVSNQSLPSVFSRDSIKVIGLPTFTDVDGDGMLEVVLFSCYDSRCNQTAVHVLHQEKFPGADVVGCQGAGESWKLSFTNIMTVNLTGISFDASSINLSLPTISDLDLDGHPDIIAPVFSHSTSSTSTNIESEGAVDPKPQLRPLVLLGSASGWLRPQWDLFSEAAVANVTLAAFFDLWEDGVLDVLMVQGGTPRGDEDIPPAGNLLAYRQSLSEDHTFLKVLVLSGHCFQNCESGQKPYGSVLPGATVSFSTTGRTGHNERSIANIQYSSSNSLQLPYVLFGLGETPNFIEALTVGAGYTMDDDMNIGNWTPNIDLQFHQWSLLVPNSQVIVIPSPIDNAKSWHIELYLTPSNLVYSTAGVLCALAVGIAIIIGLLQAREKYQDSKEKKQAKHRFHFNAM